MQRVIEIENCFVVGDNAVVCGALLLDVKVGDELFLEKTKCTIEEIESDGKSTEKAIKGMNVAMLFRGNGKMFLQGGELYR